MLKIDIPGQEYYDESKNVFIMTKGYSLTLEHSLVSLSKWESTWCKPFLTKSGKTIAESLDYIKCMTLTQNVDSEVYNFINQDMVDQVTNYIEAPMTATTFSDKEKPAINRSIITAEIIYYWMISLNIPFECQKWHLNRLLTLINVCNIKNKPPKKSSRNDILRRNAELNALRREQYNTNG